MFPLTAPLSARETAVWMGSDSLVHAEGESYVQRSVRNEQAGDGLFGARMTGPRCWDTQLTCCQMRTGASKQGVSCFLRSPLVHLKGKPMNSLIVGHQHHVEMGLIWDPDVGSAWLFAPNAVRIEVDSGRGKTT